MFHVSVEACSLKNSPFSRAETIFSESVLPIKISDLTEMPMSNRNSIDLQEEKTFKN